MDFKGTDSLFAVKLYSPKNYQSRKVLCKKYARVSSKSGIRKPGFTGRKIGGYRQKRCKKD